MVVTKAIVETLAVGDLVPNCFGKLKKVTRITYRGVSSVDGMAFVGFYQEFSENSEMSNSLREGDAL